MKDEIRPTIKNTILNSLPPDDLERLGPMLQKVELPLGQVLYDPNEPIDYVYFPHSAMVSVVGWTAEGHGVEVAVIGREGAAGAAIVLGSDSTPYENIIQLANSGWKMSKENVLNEFARRGAFHDALLIFIDKLIIQISQTALCNRLHSMEKRLSRWLLMCRDRADSDNLQLTQEFLAQMLGANRTTVAITAGELQKAGLITYKRGNMTILDRASLEAYTCECYRVIRAAYDKK